MFKVQLIKHWTYTLIIPFEGKSANGILQIPLKTLSEL